MAEKIRYYTDEHVSMAVIRGLRQRGVDVLSTPEAEMLSADDDKQLEFASENGRVIFTHDRDFVRIAAENYEHAGIVFAPRALSIGAAVNGLMLIHDVLTAEEMRGRVEYL